MILWWYTDTLYCNMKNTKVFQTRGTYALGQKWNKSGLWFEFVFYDSTTAGLFGQTRFMSSEMSLIPSWHVISSINHVMVSWSVTMVNHLTNEYLKYKSNLDLIPSLNSLIMVLIMGSLILYILILTPSGDDNWYFIWNTVSR